MTTFDFWVCDACHRMFSTNYKQTQVSVEQRSERVYGTDITYRLVEKLIICESCYRTWSGQKQ